MKTFKIKIEVSARHCHLNERDFKKLFGKDASLTPMRKLSQEGEFAAKETIGVKTKKGEFTSIRIIGPLRKYTQIEISKTDTIKLGLNPPTRMSGKLEGSSSATLIGFVSNVRIKEGVIIANRHIHANFAQAKKYGLRNGQIVQVEIKGDRALIFDKVKVKLDENYSLVMHIDTDEANACGIAKSDNFGKVIPNKI